MTTLRSIVLILAAGALLAAVAPARALGATAQVVDNGQFFSPDAVSRANRRLADVERQTGRSLRVETYAEIPADLRAAYSPDQRARFFADWAQQRARAVKLTGAMVLVCREPANISVEVGRQTVESGAFTLADRDRLLKPMAQAFREKRFDDGLIGAVETWATTVSKGRSGAPDASAAAAGAASGA
ncbi:MAG TPA: TPM domain-containing protein, partial [Tepidisphaeraceae bacterium]|nr:TPM domain-containing protein [Tepidisphaeraceae bacterium]